MHSAMHTIYIYTLYSIECTLEMYTLYTVQYTPTMSFLRVTCHMVYVTRYKSHGIGHVRDGTLYFIR